MPFKSYNFQDNFNKIKEIDGVYSLSQKIQAIISQSQEEFDNFIIEKIIEFMPEDITKIILINKEYIIEAIREKMGRENI
jgi:hypothetical protein